MSNCNTSPQRTWRTRWLGLVAGLGALFASGTGVHAQVATTYTFSQSVGTYTPITGGTLLVTQTDNVTGSAGSLEDGVVYPVSIPFTFFFDGNPYTSCTVTNNGSLSFGGTAILANNYGPIGSAAAYAGAVSAYGRDLQGGFIFAGTTTVGSNVITAASNTAGVTIGSVISGTGIPTGTTVTAFDATTVTMSANATTASTGTARWVWNGEMRTEVVGTAPNRELVIQWSNMKPFGTTLTTVNGFRMNFQVRLAEGSNNVRIVYGACQPGLNTSTTGAQVGLRGPNNTFATNVNNRTIVKNTTDWATSTAGTLNTSSLVFNNSPTANVIPSGLTYQWTAPPPPSCLNITGLAVTGITTTSINAGWNAEPGAGSYNWEVRTSGAGGSGATGLVQSGNVLTNSLAVSGLTANTTYTVWIQSNCTQASNGLSGWISVTAFTGYCVPTVTNAGDYIASFTTTNGVSNISNVTNAASAGNYGNFTAQSVSAPANGTFNYSLAYVGGTNGVRIWVDWNNNLQFESGELMSSAGPGASPQAGTVTVPNGTALGNYRMRVRAAFNVLPAAACGNETWGETEDYTLTVVLPPVCTVPTAVNASSITSTGATINWTCASCTGSFIVEYGVAPFTTPGTGGTAGAGGTVVSAAGSPQALSSLLASTTYDVYVRQNCGVNGFSANSSVTSFSTPCGVATAPYTQGFESFATTTGAVWPVTGCLTATPSNTTTAYRWDRAATTTPSTFSTGPAGPNTGTRYAYTEASSGTTGNIANLDLQVVNISSLANPALEFFYHRRGISMPTLNVQASTDGVSYTTVFTLTGQQQTAAADPWLEASVPLTAYTGATTLYIRFQAIRNTSFEGDCAIDDIAILEGPTCLVPAGLAIVSASATSVNASWTAEPNATLYNWEVRTSGAAGSGAAGLVDAGTTASTSFTSNLLSANTAYQIYVRSDCNANSDGFSEWSAALNLFTGYCTPNSTVETTFLDAFTTTGGGSNINNTGSGISPGGYGDFTAQVLSVSAGQVVNFTSLVVDNPDPPTTPDNTVGMAIWVDWNQNFIFNTNERVFNTTAFTANPGGSFTVPAAQPGGNYRMRVHINWNNNNPTDPCANAVRGETEDYTLSICSAPVATASLVENCVGQTFSVSVNMTNPGSGTSHVIAYSVNGVAQTPVSYTGPGTQIPNQPVHVVVTASLVNNDGCSVALGTFRSNCNIELDCDAPSPIQMVHCYSNGDTETWTWVNTEVGGTVALKFISGQVETNDNILLWEGAVGGTPATPATLTGNLTGQLITSVGNTLSMSISTDGTNSCASGGPGLGAGWVFQARCGGCVEPAGFVTADPNELGSPEVNCAALPVATFNAYVGISDNGIDANTGNPPATVGYRLFVNNVAQPDVTGLPGGEFYLLGAFPLGTDLDVILLHADQATQSSCNTQIATNFTVGFNACPPANDLCANAQVLTLNPDGTCPANAITGTTLGADQTGPLPSCQTTGVAQDVWYRFNSGVSSSFTMTLTAATAGNIGVELFTACGTPVSGACLANILPVNNPITITVAPETDYWLRVFTNVSTGAPGTFNICVSAFDPCLDIQNISSCGVSTQTTRPAGTGAWTNYGGPFGTPGRERIFTFTPTITGFHTISVTAITGSWVDFFFKEVSVGCNSTGWTYIDDINAVGVSTSFNLTAGTQYYIMWDPEDNTAARDVTFQVVCPVPPPANDNCAGAIALSVNAGNTCTVQTAGSIGGATDSGVVPACGTADDDVWYSFVATSTQHTVALNNVSGFTDMAFSVYTNGCGSLSQVTCSDPNSAILSGLTVGQTYLVQVYSFGTATGLTTTFDVCVSTPPPAPANDNCASAIALTVNSGLTCTVQTAGTIASATASPDAVAPCFGTADDDVWYSFVATSTSHTISLNNVLGSTSDLYHAVYSGSCGSLVNVLCSDPNSSLATGLTIGQTYLVRVYSWTSTPGQTSTFSVCVGTPPPPPANDNCAGAIALTVNPNYLCGSVTPGTIAFATASPVDAVACGGTEDDDVWFSFVATSTTHRIDLRNVAGSTTDLFHSLWTGSCGALTLVPGSCSDPNTSNPTGLTPGTTYYLRVYSWTATTGQTSTFDVCIGTLPPPPANDECAAAVLLPVNAGLVCAAQTAGTLLSATNSGVAVAPCTGTADDDVWYRFTATSTQHIITLSSVLPTTTMRMQLFTGACGALTSFACGAVDSYTTPNTLVVGTQYYVRVYSNGATPVESNFNICVTTPPVGPPANDNCAGAIALTVNAGQTCVAQTFGTVFGATGTADATCAGAEDDDVWYSFVATSAAHTVSLNSVSGSVTSMNFQVLGGTCGAPTSIVCSTTGATANAVASPLTIGATYYVRVYTNTATAGQNTTFNVCVTSPPANDLCSNAIAVACNSVVSGSTVGATNIGRPTGTCTDAAINDPYVDNSAAGVWYTVQGWGGPMTVSLCGSTFDTQIGVFAGSCGTFTCVAGNDDAGAACPSSGTRSIATWNSVAGTTYYVYVTAWTNGTTGAFTLTTTCGSTAAVCAANGLNLEFQNDANPGQVTWEVLNAAGTVTAISGSNGIPANAIGNQSVCLPNGCYRLRVLDSAGDGMTTGGYELRNSGDGARIIDNTNNFSTGSVSAIANGGSFCLPIGTDKLIFSSCDRLDWVNNRFIVASANPVVSAQFGVTNATSGYEFWFFDPNGSYSYRRFRSHATSDGFGTGATRACHFKVNGWVNSVANPHLPANVLLNVRVRGRVAGNNLEFGPACQFKIDPALASCPRVSLQDDPANADFSCGVSRNFGGGGSALNRIYAKPPQPVPAVASSNVRYQFRFRIPGENVCIVRPPQTSAQMTLNWTTGTPLQCSKTYEVDVRVSLDGGASWCFGPASSSEASACADTEDWGKVCDVTINPCPAFNGGSSAMVVEGNSTFTMYPNPNRGDQLFLSVTNVEDEVNTVSVDIFDMTGKRVMARTIAVQDGFVNTNLELNGDLAGGLYMVNITAGTKAYTERLVIQP